MLDVSIFSVPLQAQILIEMAKQPHNEKNRNKNCIVMPPQVPKSSLKHDIWTAIFTVLALVIAYIIQIFFSGGQDALSAYLASQATLVTFYANILAVLSVTYGKATANFDISGKTYLLSMLGYILVAHIFVQAIFMVYPEIKLYAEFMRSKWLCIIGNLILFGIIFAISCSKGTSDYSKEILQETTKKKH